MIRDKKELQEQNINQQCAIEKLKKFQEEQLSKKDNDLEKRLSKIRVLEWQLKNPAKYKEGDVIGEWTIVEVTIKEPDFFQWAMVGTMNCIFGGLNYAIKESTPPPMRAYEYHVMTIKRPIDLSKTIMSESQLDELSKQKKPKEIKVKKIKTK